MTPKGNRPKSTPPYAMPNQYMRAIFTLDNIFKYTSEDELRAVVSSIINRLNKNRDVYLDKKAKFENGMPNYHYRYLVNCPMGILDTDLDKFVKELRDVK